MLNERLVELKGITPEAQEEILKVHDHLTLINKNIGDYVASIGHKGVAELVTELDYKLQELWGFPKNPDYHTHWFNIEGCLCPKLDNQERVGSGSRWISKSCPFHGDLYDA